MELPVDFPVNREEWDKTPRSVQVVVLVLWQENQILRQQVAHIQVEMGKLAERVNKNSQNSSKPPSSDTFSKSKYPKKEASGQKKGGQPGHKGKGRKLKPLDQVNKVVVLKPTACTECGSLLLGEDAHPQRHQVSELPRIVPEIVEYQRHTVACLVCGTENQAEWPVDMPRGSFGERVQAMTGYLGGRFGISQRDMVEMFETVFHLEIGLGSISAQEERVSQALKQPVDTALEYAQQQTAKNMDETSWHELTKLCWLWVCVTPGVSVFRIFKTRGASGVRELLGENLVGILGSDRYSAYNWIDPEKRQACWAHLKRDFQAWVERGGESKTVGRLLLEQVKLFFGLWHRVRDGTLSRIDFQCVMQPIRREVKSLLCIGTFVNQTQTRKTCQNILQLEQALWTFVDHEGIEPTNNAAERALRRAVIWRKRSFGTQSEKGSRFFERIMTTVTTLRQQNWDVLDYLTTACHANLLGITAPSLLPAV
jgi:transposase